MSNATIHNYLPCLPLIKCDAHASKIVLVKASYHLLVPCNGSLAVMNSLANKNSVFTHLSLDQAYYMNDNDSTVNFQGIPQVATMLCNEQTQVFAKVK